MYQMYGTLVDTRYTTDALNVTRQALNPIELQTQLTSSLTMLICPKHPQQTQQKFQHLN